MAERPQVLPQRILGPRLLLDVRNAFLVDRPGRALKFVGGHGMQGHSDDRDIRYSEFCLPDNEALGVDRFLHSNRRSQILAILTLVSPHDHVHYGSGHTQLPCWWFCTHQLPRAHGYVRTLRIAHHMGTAFHHLRTAHPVRDCYEHTRLRIHNSIVL